MLNGLSPRDRVEADEDWVAIIESKKLESRLYYLKSGEWQVKSVKLEPVTYGTSALFLYNGVIYDYRTNLGKIKNGYPHARYVFNNDRGNLFTVDGRHFFTISNDSYVHSDANEAINHPKPELDLLKITLDQSTSKCFFEKISPDDLNKSSETVQVYSQLHTHLEEIHSKALGLFKGAGPRNRMSYGISLHYKNREKGCNITGNIYYNDKREQIIYQVPGVEIQNTTFYQAWFSDKFSKILDKTVGTTSNIELITPSGKSIDSSLKGYDYYVIKSSDIALLSDQSQELSKYLPQLTETLNAYLPSVSIIPVQKQSSTNSQNHTNQHAQSTGHAPNHGLADMQLVDVLHSISFELSRIADSLENSKR